MPKVRLLIFIEKYGIVRLDMATQLFKDRMQAGELLAERLEAYARCPDVVVLALPRGGVPVGFAVANALQVPLDIMLVRKLGVPGHEELAMGAVASGGICVINPEVVEMLNIPPSVIEEEAQHELQEIERRETLYRAGRPPSALNQRIVILVDDGLATGSTMLAAVKALRKESPARIIAAVPVAPPETCEELGTEVDEMVCLSTPQDFYAVGLWYGNFAQTTDEEVISLLAQAPQSRALGTVQSGETISKQKDNRDTHHRI
jgi:putative phosphoribosyl transferase